MQYIKNIPQIFKNINKYTSGIHYYSKQKTALICTNEVKREAVPKPILFI